MDYHSLPRRQLQTLCKKHGIPANATNADMADALSALLNPKPQPQAEKGKEAEKRATRGRESSSNVAVSEEKVSGDISAQNSEAHTKTQRATRGREAASTITQVPRTAVSRNKKASGNGETESNTAQKQELLTVSTRNAGSKEKTYNNGEVESNSAEELDLKTTSPKSEGRKGRAGGIVLRKGKAKVRSPRRHSRSPKSEEKVTDTAAERASKGVGEEKLGHSCLVNAKEAQSKKKKGAVTFSDTVEVKLTEANHPAEETPHFADEKKTRTRNKEPDEERIVEIQQVGRSSRSSKHQTSEAASVVQKIVRTRSGIRKASSQEMTGGSVGQKRRGKPVPETSKAEESHATINASQKLGDKETGEKDACKQTIQDNPHGSARQGSKKGSVHVREPIARENAETFIQANQVEFAPPLESTRRSRRLTLSASEKVHIQDKELEARPEEHHEGSCIILKEFGDALPEGTSRRSRRKTFVVSEIGLMQSTTETVPEQIDKSKPHVLESEDHQSKDNTTEIVHEKQGKGMDRPESQQAHRRTRAGKNIPGASQLEFSHKSQEKEKSQIEATNTTGRMSRSTRNTTTSSISQDNLSEVMSKPTLERQTRRTKGYLEPLERQEVIEEKCKENARTGVTVKACARSSSKTPILNKQEQSGLEDIINLSSDGENNDSRSLQCPSELHNGDAVIQRQTSSEVTSSFPCNEGIDYSVCTTEAENLSKQAIHSPTCESKTAQSSPFEIKICDELITSTGKYIEINTENPTLDDNISECLQVNEVSGRKECQVVKQGGYFIDVLRGEGSSLSDADDTMLGRTPVTVVHSGSSYLLDKDYFLDRFKHERSLVTCTDEVMTASPPAANMGLTYEQNNGVEGGICEDEAHHSERHLAACSSEFSMNSQQALSEDNIVNNDINAASFSEEKEGLGQEVDLALSGEEEKSAGQEDKQYHDEKKENQLVDASAEMDCGHELPVSEKRAVDENSATNVGGLRELHSSIYAVQAEISKLLPGSCWTEMLESSPYMSGNQTDNDGESFEAFSKNITSGGSDASSSEKGESFERTEEFSPNIKEYLSDREGDLTDSFDRTEEFSSDIEEYISDREGDFSDSVDDTFSGSEDECSENEEELLNGEEYSEMEEELSDSEEEFSESEEEFSESEEELSDSEEEFSESEEDDLEREEDILQSNKREDFIINDEKPGTTGKAGIVEEIPKDEFSNVDEKPAGSTLVLANYEAAPVLVVSSKDFETLNTRIGLGDGEEMHLAAHVSDESLPVDEVSQVKNKDFADSINCLDTVDGTDGCLLEVRTNDFHERMSEQDDELPEINRKIDERSLEMLNDFSTSSYGHKEPIDGGAQSLVDSTVLGESWSSSESSVVEYSTVKVKEDGYHLIAPSSRNHPDKDTFEGPELMESHLNNAVEKGKEHCIVAASLGCESDLESLGPRKYIYGCVEAEVVAQSMSDASFNQSQIETLEMVGKSKSSLMQLKDGEQCQIETCEMLDDTEVEQQQMLKVDESFSRDIADAEPLGSSHEIVEPVDECTVVAAVVDSVDGQALVGMDSVKVELKDAVENLKSVQSELIEEDLHETEQSDTEAFEDSESMNMHRDLNDTMVKELLKNEEDECATTVSDFQQDSACCILPDLMDGLEDKGEGCLVAADVISPDKVLKMAESKEQVELGSSEVDQIDTCGVEGKNYSSNQFIELFEVKIEKECPVRSHEREDRSHEREDSSVDSTLELKSGMDFFKPLELAERENMAVSSENETEQVELAVMENLAGSNDTAAEQVVQKAQIKERFKDLLQNSVQEEKDCSIEVLKQGDEDAIAFDPAYLETGTAAIVVSADLAKEAEHNIDTGYASVLGNEVSELSPEFPCDMPEEEDSSILPEYEQEKMHIDAFDNLKTNNTEEGSEIMQFENEALSFVPEVGPGAMIEENQDLECNASDSNKDTESVLVSTKESLIGLAISSPESLQAPIESIAEKKVMNAEGIGAYLEELHKEASEEIQPSGEPKQNLGKEPVAAPDTTAEISKEQSLQQFDLTLLSLRKLREMCKENGMSARKQSDNGMSVRKQSDNGTPAARKPFNTWMSARKQSDNGTPARKQLDQATTSTHPRELPSASKRSALKALPSNIRQTSSAAVQTPTAKMMQGPRNLLSAYDGNEGTEQRLVTPSPQAPLSSRRDFARSHHR